MAESTRVDRLLGSPAVDVTVGDDESVVMTVLQAVAAVDGTPPLSLPPLTEAVDPDALCAIVQSMGRGGCVAFAYHGYEVVVSGSETVEIYETG